MHLILKIEMGENNIICRLCLEIVAEDSVAIEEKEKEILEVLLINIDLNATHDAVACNKCLEEIQSCSQYISTCFYVSDYIASFVVAEGKVDIKKVYQKKLGSKTNVDMENAKICRLCLSFIEDNSALSYNADLKHMIGNCLPEVDLNTVYDPIFCVLCLGKMKRLNEFMKTCHEAQQTIKNYYHVAADHGISGKITLHDLLKFKNYDSKPIKEELNFNGDAYLRSIDELSTSIKWEKLHIKNELDRDMQMSSKNKRIFKCHYCDVESKCEQSLNDHISVIHEGIRILNKQELRTHLRQHEEESQYKCPDCDKRFKTKRKLDTHLLTNHEKLHHLITAKIHECKFCTYKTMFSAHFNVHVARNHNNKNGKKFQCHSCDYSSCEKSTLKRHILVHSNFRPHQCTSCEYRFSRKSFLDSHILKNHKENGDLLKTITSKIHQCTLCKYVTIDKNKLFNHIKTNHKQ